MSRALDGPYDKQEVRKSISEIQRELRDGLAVRVPGSPSEPDYGSMARIKSEPGDLGYRWTHIAKDAPEGEPVSFDAGACNLFATPLGWRVLICYHHDDPTYGINVLIFDPWGRIHKSGSELNGIDAIMFVRHYLP